MTEAERLADKFVNVLDDDDGRKAQAEVAERLATDSELTARVCVEIMAMLDQDMAIEAASDLADRIEEVK